MKKTLVPNPDAADGKLGTGSFANGIPPEATPVPNPMAASGSLGTGSFAHGVPAEATPVPNPAKASGQIGTGSNQATVPETNTKTTYVPTKTGADNQPVTPPTPPPPTPTTPVISLDAPNSSHSSIKLNISNSVPPDTYEVWMSTDGGQNYSQVTTIAGSSTSYTHSSAMSSGTMRSYKLRSTGLSGYSNIVGPLVYMQYGGAVLVQTYFTAPAVVYTLYTATVDNDGGATFNGGQYGAPIANSRGAVLNSAVTTYNQLIGGPTIVPYSNSLFLSAGTFDVGGAWSANPRFYWANARTSQVGMGIFGQGMNSTFIQLSSSTTTWGPAFNAFLPGNGTILKDFSINQYYDGPDRMIAPIDTNFLWMKNVRVDGTRCRDGSSNVVKGGIMAGGIPDGCAYSILDTGDLNVPFGANLIDCEFYAGGNFIISAASTVGGVNCYTCSFYRKILRDYEDFNITANQANAFNFYHCIIDGGNIASYGATTYYDPGIISLYDQTTFQNRHVGVDDYDLSDASNSGLSIQVSPSVVYSVAYVPPVVVSEPTYTVPSLPVNTAVPYNDPVFLS